MNEELTVFDTIDLAATGDIRSKIRDILGAFMFGGEASDKRVKVLSGGERSRLAMIRLLLEPVNLLILDEPTNHLDMASKDVLKKAIEAFEGTAIIVSHDRDFLDGLVGKVYEFGAGRVREHLGGIYEFLEKRELDSLQQLERNATLAGRDNGGKKEEQQEPMSEGKRSYQEQKAWSRKMRKLERDIEKAEEKVEQLENKITKMEEHLATPGGAADMELLQKYLETKAKLDRVLNLWERLALELEETNR